MSNRATTSSPRFYDGEDDKARRLNLMQSTPSPLHHETEPLPPLRSLHSSNLPGILDQLGASLMVTTYQAGKLVLVRPDKGVINTHFRAFHQLMGRAIGNERLAIGTEQEIIEFRNVPAAAKRLTPNDKHDACYLPRTAHVTGNVLIHEMAYGGEELWFINTRFSCLCTFDRDHSFVPRWRPRFILNLIPGDCCHLNGLAMKDGQPRWVTALGETPEPEGWRKNKRNGGILIDVATEQIIVRGLSMPHSPRWYRNRLWLLESGSGSLGYVNQETGKYESIARLGGFTRGLDFCGELAFVGMSQVRETATFSGLEITERLKDEERICGVYVIEITSGRTIAFLQFEDAVQEIFSVRVLTGKRYPVGSKYPVEPQLAC